MFIYKPIHNSDKDKILSAITANSWETKVDYHVLQTLNKSYLGQTVVYLKQPVKENGNKEE